MVTILAEITTLEKVFITCALFGGGLFIFRMIMMLMGFGHHDIGGDGGDAGGISDMDGHGGDMHHGHADADLSFKTLSMQGITAFIMMFGLVGWAMLAQSRSSPFLAIIAALLAGYVMVWVIKKIFQLASTFQSSGTLDMTKAIGQQGSIYLTIHPGQIGKVQVIVQERLMVLDANSNCPEDIKTGEPVIVTEVNNNILTVERKQL
jgi:hypothetical protein